ncbi:MAG: tripartite tricarboxylate transporter TctB family protein [Hyphomicrobiaceae bacterium]
METAESHQADEPPLASIRSAEIVVALLFLGAAGILLLDATRLGFRWIDGQGPGAGYFPFYLGCLLAVSSLVNLVRAATMVSGGEAFTSRPAAMRVLSVLGPAIVYVALIGGVSLGPVQVPALGIYVSSTVFIAFFMLVFGREGPIAALLVGVGVPLAFFLIFERWFLVPLPKGPLEAWLGLA